MSDPNALVERDPEETESDPDAVSIQDRHVYTQPYDLVVESLLDQIKSGTIFLRPLSERPSFQRRYVWTDVLASRLVESILLNVPIPPCYLSQNEDFELDVIDGQQRLFSIYRYLNNQFALIGLEAFTELNGARFHQLPPTFQRQLKTHTLRLVAITNESHPDVKFDVFQRLNTNTVPLNAQELRNCVYRGALNELLKDAVQYPPWLRILRRKAPDKRMRDEELALRFFAFHVHGIKSYKTPQKYWLNDAAKAGQTYGPQRVAKLNDAWTQGIDVALAWFIPPECFRRPGATVINRALFDLTMKSATGLSVQAATKARSDFRRAYGELLEDEEFTDLISRAVDHSKRTKRRFKMWDERVGSVLG